MCCARSGPSPPSGSNRSAAVCGRSLIRCPGRSAASRSGSRPSPICASTPTTTRSIRGWPAAGSRSNLPARARGGGARRRRARLPPSYRSFAKDSTFTDPAHRGGARAAARPATSRARGRAAAARPLRPADPGVSKGAELAHLFRTLKAPAAARALPKLAARAREEEWGYERFAEALLSTEVASRESHGGESRIKAARFPAARRSRSSTSASSARSSARWSSTSASSTSSTPRRTWSCSARPGRAEPSRDRDLDPRLPRRPARPVRHRDRLGGSPRGRQAPRQPRDRAQTAGLRPLIVVDEVGYIPFDPEAANLMFSLVSARYEQASVIVTSNKPFSAQGEIFGDEVVAAAMIDGSSTTPRSSPSRATATGCATKTSAPQQAATERPPAPPRPTGSAPRRTSQPGG